MVPGAGMMVVLVPVGAGSAPGVPSGRWVAGCCASGADVAHGLDGGDAAMPFPTGSSGPADGVSGPQQRLVAGWAVVVDRMEAVVDAGEGVGDRGAVPGSLGGVLVIQRPCGHPGADDEPSGCLEEQVTAAEAAVALGTPVAQDHGGEALDAGDGVEQEAPPTG